MSNVTASRRGRSAGDNVQKSYEQQQQINKKDRTRNNSINRRSKKNQQNVSIAAAELQSTLSQHNGGSGNMERLHSSSNQISCNNSQIQNNSNTKNTGQPHSASARFSNNSQIQNNSNTQNTGQPHSASARSCNNSQIQNNSNTQTTGQPHSVSARSASTSAYSSSGQPVPSIPCNQNAILSQIISIPMESDVGISSKSDKQDIINFMMKEMKNG